MALSKQLRERQKMENKLQKLSKTMDYLERAKREEAARLIEAAFQQRLVEEKALYELEQQQEIELSRQHHDGDLWEKNRLARVLDSKTILEERVRSRRKAEFDRQRAERGERVNQIIQARKKERKTNRKKIFYVRSEEERLKRLCEEEEARKHEENNNDYDSEVTVEAENKKTMYKHRDSVGVSGDEGTDTDAITDSAKNVEETDLENNVAQVQVFLDCMKTTIVFVHLWDKVASFKQQVQEKIGIPANSQLLVCDGKLLMDDEKRLCEYGIKKNCVIQVLLRILGGMEGAALNPLLIATPEQRERGDEARELLLQVQAARNTVTDIENQLGQRTEVRRRINRINQEIDRVRKNQVIGNLKELEEELTMQIERIQNFDQEEEIALTFDVKMHKSICEEWEMQLRDLIRRHRMMTVREMEELDVLRIVQMQCFILVHQQAWDIVAASRNIQHILGVLFFN